MYSTYDNIVDSLKLAWKHKYLWVVALLLLAGGGNYSVSSENQTETDGDTLRDLQQEYDLTNFDDSSLKDKELEFDDSFINNAETNVPTPQERSPFGEIKDAVLGVSDVLSETAGIPSPSTPDFDKIMEKLLSYIIILAPVFLLIVLFLIFVGLVIRGWAQGAMLGGTYDGSKEDGEVTLRSLGRHGRISLGQMVRFNVFVAIITFGVMVLLGVVSGILIATVGSIGIIFSIPLIAVFLLFILRLALLIPFATRHIVFKEMKYKLAYKEGIKSMYANFGKVMGLVFGNCLVFLLFIAIFIVVVGIIGVGLFSGVETTESPGSVLVILAIPLGVALIIGMQVAMAYFVTFVNFTWTKLYAFVEKLDVKEEENEIRESRLPPKPKPKPQPQAEENLEPQAQGKTEDGK